MCSTPRSSGSIRKVHHFPTSGAQLASYSQMMQRASELCERNKQQHKQAKKQQLELQANENNITIENFELIDIPEANNPIDKNQPITKNSLKQRIIHFMTSQIAKIPPIVTT